MKTRTKLRDRAMPVYTKGEEIFNMVSHIAGGALGIVALVLCIVFPALKGDVWAVVSGAVYGSSLIILYTISSIYHGLNINMGKRVMQVLDHCAIYFLIAGTYTPILLCAIRRISPLTAWILFGVVWGLAALATTLTAIDLKRYSKFSLVCYVGMGWCIVPAAKTAIRAISQEGLMLLLVGGIAYTVGAVLYCLGKKMKYMHSVFHLFVVIGSILHFFLILFYVI